MDKFTFSMKRLFTLLSLLAIFAFIGCKPEPEEKPETQPNNEIWYTSYWGDKIYPTTTSDKGIFGATFTHNTYEDGKGVFEFDADVTSIGNEAFTGQDRLLTISLPNSVKYIGLHAFEKCYGLTSIELPENLWSIDSYAFAQCWNLKTITLGERVSIIGSGAFEDCRSLLNIYCKAQIPPTTGNYPFKKSGGFTIFVPKESVDAYKESTYWSDYADHIVGYDFE